LTVHSEHFLRDVLATGDRNPVVARCDVYASGRIKLVKQGVRLTSAMYDQLVNHKLLEPLEQCLDVEHGVRRDSLAQAVRALLVPGGHFALLTQQVTRGKLASAFSNVALPAPIAFKLTVAREQRPSGNPATIGGLEGHRQQLQAIADVLIDWSRTRAEIEACANEDARDALLGFVTARVDRLNRVLLATGFDPRDVDGFVGMLANDGTLRGELSAIAHEATWAFGEVRLEMRRRWGEFAAVPQPSRAAVEAWLARADRRMASVVAR
jgi:hypothetical protein